MNYNVKNIDIVPTPQLIYYKDIIEYNIKLAVEIAGDAAKIRAHVKSHKTVQIPLMQLKYGINKFKTATIAETEMLAMNGFKDILLGYPLVGPNIKRFVTLAQTYMAAKLYAITDNKECANEISEQAAKAGVTINLLVDLDPGLHRTGASLENTAEAFKLCQHISNLPNIHFAGLHIYDANNRHTDLEKRMAATAITYEKASALKKELIGAGINVEKLVIGGTPTFPCYARYQDVELSPGTCFLQDMRYQALAPDMKFIPAAAIATRVVSVTGADTVTLDIGVKAVATELPAGERMTIVGDIKMEHVNQNEEHWMVRITEGATPKVGDVFYAIPSHVCPTSALYEEIYVADESRNIAEIWHVLARKRKINI